MYISSRQYIQTVSPFSSSCQEQAQAHQLSDYKSHHIFCDCCLCRRWTSSQELKIPSDCKDASLILRRLIMSTNPWRRYLWLWVIVGMILASFVIILIFLLINKCISRKGKHRISHLQKGSNYSVKSNKYQERIFNTATPPLPPRTQFLTAEAQSYENLAEVPDHVQTTPNHRQDVDDHKQVVDDHEQATNDYEQLANDYEQPVNDYEQPANDYVQPVDDYEQPANDYVQPVDDYEQPANDYLEPVDDYLEPVDDYLEPVDNYEQLANDYEQNIPDYVKVEDEDNILLPPPPCNNPDADNASTEDYDDIGGEDEIQEDEDYDDVE
uniref:uncharacterized protein LOC124070405 isoform X1 n=2 Tax=Scatophagus argus TaxID=75038 RepID=UPI001ED8045C|nr:uncharacterized protein LOC124070405 isoform X1 [Scatophagus argus]